MISNILYGIHISRRLDPPPHQIHQLRVQACSVERHALNATNINVINALNALVGTKL